MFSVSSMLVKQEVLDKVPMIVSIVCGVIVLFAFLGGFAKGFRRISWWGLTWLAAGAAFIFANKEWNADMPFWDMNAFEKLNPAVVFCICSAAIGGACILLALLLKGMLAFAFRPRKKVVKDNRAKKYYEDDDDAFEDGFDGEYEENDGRRVVVRKGYGRPNFFGRLFGGLINAVNAAAVCAVIVAIGLFIVAFTNPVYEDVGGIFMVKLTREVFEFVQKYALDFISLGIIMGVTASGYKKGFLATLRGFIIQFGGIVAVVACFWLPFSKLTDSWEFLGDAVEKFIKLFHGLKGKTPDILGKIVLGLVSAIVMIIVFVLLNILLKKLSKCIKAHRVSRAIDGWLATILYFVFGILVCALVWGVFYTLEYYELIYISRTLTEDSIFANSIYFTGEEYLGEWLSKMKIKA